MDTFCWGCMMPQEQSIPGVHQQIRGRISETSAFNTKFFNTKIFQQKKLKKFCVENFVLKNLVLKNFVLKIFCVENVCVDIGPRSHLMGYARVLPGLVGYDSV